MKIAVCIKQVPDTSSEKKLDPSDNTLDRASVDGVMNELCEYAVEEALLIAEANEGSEVVVVTVGPDAATETIRKALSMGADSAIHVSDDALHGSDALATSLAIAKALEGKGFDLVIFGSESTDARMSVIPAMVAERLNVSQLTFANKVEVSGSDVKIQRITDEGYDVVNGTTPAVISVVEKINEPRYPSFKGIMAAKKKPIETVGLGDIGVDAGVVGLAGAKSEVVSFEAAPARAAGTIVTDEGNGGKQIADYLSEQKFF